MSIPKEIVFVRPEEDITEGFDDDTVYIGDLGRRIKYKKQPYIHQFVTLSNPEYQDLLSPLLSLSEYTCIIVRESPSSEGIFIEAKNIVSDIEDRISSYMAANPRRIHSNYCIIYDLLGTVYYGPECLRVIGVVDCL